MATLRDFEGDKAALGKVEQFFLEVMEIPRYGARLECFLFKQRFGREAEELGAALATVRRAVAELEGSAKFRRLLEVVLRLGNFLNGGTSRGGLYGFKLDALPKLATLKSVDGKATLMNFLADWCLAREPELLALGEDLPSCAAAARTPLAGWAAAFKALEAKVGLVRDEVEACRGAPRLAGDGFLGCMEPFKAKAEAATKALAEAYEAAERAFEACCERFGEDKAAVGCGELFGGTVGAFVEELGKAHAQNEKRRAVEDKARKKAEEAARKEAQREARAKVCVWSACSSSSSSLSTSFAFSSHFLLLTVTLS